MPNYLNFIYSVFLFLSISYAQKTLIEQVDSLDLSNSAIEVLGKNVEIRWQQFKVNENQKAEIESGLKTKTRVPEIISYAEIKANQKLFYLILDEAPGKTETFIYALYLNENLSIKDVDILLYRELYGGEIDEESFRDQFAGIVKPQQIIFGRTIQGVTGATISSQSITYHVRDLLMIFKETLRTGR